MTRLELRISDDEIVRMEPPALFRGMGLPFSHWFGIEMRRRLIDAGFDLTRPFSVSEDAFGGVRVFTQLRDPLNAPGRRPAFRSVVSGREPLYAVPSPDDTQPPREPDEPAVPDGTNTRPLPDEDDFH